MKRLIISIGWLGLCAAMLSVLWIVEVDWNVLLIVILGLFIVSLILGVIAILKKDEVALIPLLLGGFTLGCLCTIIEINSLFVISAIYFIGMMIYFVSYHNLYSQN